MSRKEEYISLTHDANPRIRAAAIRGLSEMFDSTLTSIILDALKDPAWQVRVEAVLALGRTHTVEVIPTIQHCLEDESAQVRQVTRDVFKELRRNQKLNNSIAENMVKDHRNLQQLNWPTWWNRVEFFFSTIASLVMFLSTIRFLIVNAWGDYATGQVLWSILLTCILLGTFLFVFILTGLLQSTLRFWEIGQFLKEKPWRRLVGLLFVVDVVGFFINGFIGDVIFLVALSAGLPLSIAFFASEFYNAHRKKSALEKVTQIPCD